MKTFLRRHRIPWTVCAGLICAALAFWFRGPVGLMLLVIAIYSVAKAIRWSVLG